MRTLRQILNEKEENREIQNIPPEELNELLTNLSTRHASQMTQNMSRAHYVE
jgi:hypothetical protein